MMLLRRKVAPKGEIASQLRMQGVVNRGRDVLCRSRSRWRDGVEVLYTPVLTETGR